MSKAVLFFYRHHEREGIVPVDTYETPGRLISDYLGEVNYHLANILQKFVNEPFENNPFWLERASKFNPSERAGYGYVYALQEHDNQTKLPADAYEAAKMIAVSIIHSELWEDLVDEDRYTETSYKVSDIPDTAPAVDETVPVDPRYTVGDVLVNNRGDRLTYAGVYHDPRNSDYTRNTVTVDHRQGTILIGVGVNGYVREVDVVAYVKEHPMTVHPLPLVARRVTANGTKWFAWSSDLKNMEGLGRTQKEAKESLAYKALTRQ